MVDTAQRLMQMKRRVDEARAETSRLEGRLESAMSALKQQGCSSVEEGKAKLKELHSQIKDMEEELDAGIEQLEEEYDL